MRIVAAILAGGLGTRLRPVLGGLPKPLAPIRGQPFISYLIDQLDEIRPTRIVVCAGHRGGQFVRHLEHREDILVAQEEWPLGSAGALRNSIDLFDAETVLVLNGDSYVDCSLAHFRDWKETQAYEGALLIDRVRNSSGVATVEIDPPGRISALYKISRSVEPGWINTGVALLPRAWLRELPGETPLSLERDVMPYWLARGIGACCVHAPFLTIATPQAMADAPAFFASIRRRGELGAPA